MRFTVNEGDYVKSKACKNCKQENKQENKHENKQEGRQENKQDIKKDDEKSLKYYPYYGIVSDLSRLENGFVGINIKLRNKLNNASNNSGNVGNKVFIELKNILQVFSSKIVPVISPRIALKNLWSDFIFREVKITKNTGIKYADYHYIGKKGFEKNKRYKSLESALAHHDNFEHRNIVPYYEDFYGFTTIKALKNNDVHYDREIFFSKVCYSELDWGKTPTADFSFNERGLLEIPPPPDTIICGIVENGEKGLFYRKWFLCSKQFMLLWSMVCEPTDPSVLTKDGKIKDLDVLLKELDTSCYSINYKTEIEERKKNYQVYHIEKHALYFSNIYTQVAELLFNRLCLGGLKSNSYSDASVKLMNDFQRKLYKNILWVKKLDNKNTLK